MLDRRRFTIPAGVPVNGDSPEVREGRNFKVDRRAIQQPGGMFGTSRIPGRAGISYHAAKHLLNKYEKAAHSAGANSRKIRTPPAMPGCRRVKPGGCVNGWPRLQVGDGRRMRPWLASTLPFWQFWVRFVERMLDRGCHFGRNGFVRRASSSSVTRQSRVVTPTLSEELATIDRGERDSYDCAVHARTTRNGVELGPIA
jgi:hypothetical protein